MHLIKCKKKNLKIKRNVIQTTCMGRRIIRGVESFGRTHYDHRDNDDPNDSFQMIPRQDKPAVFLK